MEETEGLCPEQNIRFPPLGLQDLEGKEGYEAGKVRGQHASCSLVKQNRSIVTALSCFLFSLLTSFFPDFLLLLDSFIFKSLFFLYFTKNI